jgi:hypothetical protein
MCHVCGRLLVCLGVIQSECTDGNMSRRQEREHAYRFLATTTSHQCACVVWVCGGQAEAFLTFMGLRLTVRAALLKPRLL